MKKNILLPLLLFALLSGFYSDNGFSFKRSNSYKIGGGEIEKVLGRIDDYVYAEVTKGKRHHIIKYSMRGIAEKIPVKLNRGDKKLNYVNCFISGDKIITVTSFINLKKKEEYFFSNALDAKNMKYSDDMQLIGSVEVKSNKVHGSLSYAYSEDKSKTVAFMFNSDNKKESNQEIVFAVFDKGELMWKKTKTIDYKDSEFFAGGYAVDNKGNVYSEGQLWISKLSRKVSLVENHVLVFNKDNKFEDIVLEMKDVYISLNQTKLTVDANQNIIVAGLYSYERGFRQDGTFYIRLNGKTHKTDISKFSFFKPDFTVDDIYSKAPVLKNRPGSTVKKNVKYLMNYLLKDLHVYKDGSVLLLAEQFGGTSNPNGNVIFYNSVKNILLVRIDKYGKIKWNKKIKKVQTGNYKILSFVYGVHDGSIYIVFNDSRKNNKPRKSPATYEGDKNLYLVLYTFDENGNGKRTNVVDGKKTNFYMITEFSFFDEEKNSFIINRGYIKIDFAILDINK